MSRVFDVSCGIRAQHLADRDVLPVLHRDDRADLEGDVHGQVGAGELDLLAVGVDSLTCGRTPSPTRRPGAWGR